MFKAIVCTDSKGGIGKYNAIPWVFKEDLKRFKDKTINNNIIMGRKTFESFPNQEPLKDRTNIVLTTDRKYRLNLPNVKIAHSLEEVLEIYKEGWIIGGSSIYKLFEQYVSEIDMTVIHKNYECDTFFSLKYPMHKYQQTNFEKLYSKSLDCYYNRYTLNKKC